MARSRLRSVPLGDLPTLVGPSVRDALRLEQQARTARAEAEKWDAEAAARLRGEAAADARDRARAARRRVVRARVAWLLATGARDALLVRLDRWLDEERIDAAALDRLADCLEVTTDERS